MFRKIAKAKRDLEPHHLDPDSDELYEASDWWKRWTEQDLKRLEAPRRRYPEEHFDEVARGVYRWA